MNSDSQINQITRGLRFAVALFSPAAGWYAVQAVSRAPQYQKMFEDMRGPDAEWPVSFAVLVQHHGTLAVAAGVLALVSMGVAWRARSIQLVLMLGAVTVLAELVLGWWASAAVMRPLHEIMRSLTSG